MQSLIRWKEGLWALIVLLAASVMACGLADSFTFLARPPTYVQGHRLVLLGALAFAGSSVWAAIDRRSLRAIISTALPAVLVGGFAVQMPDSILPNVAGLALIPIALAAMLLEIPAPRLTDPAAGGPSR
jgi:hypothetical protein